MQRRLHSLRLLALMWRVPLALASFALFKSVRFLLRRIVSLHFRLHKELAYQWQALSAESLGKPFALAYLMTTGPRWNTHAIIGGLGPLRVQRSLCLDLAAAAHSTKSWSIVLYEFPGGRTVTSINSSHLSSETPCYVVDLVPGRYGIALRYYQWSDTICCPTVSIDGCVAVLARSISPSVNDFYRDLPRRSNVFYLCLHYYMTVLLRYKDWLPRSFVESEFLPVGNPDTRFQYGFLERGASLVVQIDPKVQAEYAVYLTLYSRASFPIFWCQIREPEMTLAPCTADCMYVVRNQKISPTEREPPRSQEFCRIRTLRV